MAKYDRTNYNHARQKPLLQFLEDNLIGGNNSHGYAKEAETYLLAQLGILQNWEANTHEMCME